MASQNIVPCPRPKRFKPIVVEDELPDGRWQRLLDANGRKHYLPAEAGELIALYTTGAKAWTKAGVLVKKSCP